MDTLPFGPNAILISPTDMAHKVGCWHNDEPRIRSGEHPGWGWIPEAAAEQWLRIGEGQPLQATEGDTSRSAQRRCKTCPSD
ncbi:MULTISPECIES: hypothetical protein [Nocardiopsidaceae]|uniref:Uncharacterized protein n=2 Tax=Nocardiopsidaceae TaxID=83676 RepID=A0ABY6YT48_9ACTN|nr:MULTISPECIES: hypothetical protein [Nocardiopsaceae]MEE2044971.1 hypothetical protein [Nocardiopsis tropica]MEE2048950.1 hypothetical protein [Nocardiopsis umidischolae]WAE75563.1 hypothetical protein OUQ99_10970 [Streptomonospora nanhaiensis]